MPRKVNGFITLHRQILDWEWYKNINTKVLFLHLLLKANYKDLNFEGHKILRGQLVTSLPSLSSELGLSIHQIRVSLDKLIMTGEVASKSYNRYRVITIVKYDQYQNDDSQDGSQVADELTAKWQTDGSQVAGRWQADGRQMAASKQYNNSNKGTMEQGNNNISCLFDQFWSAYPRKESKPKAKTAFEKVKPDEVLLQKMLDSIERWKATSQWQNDGGRYVPHPATWLNQRRWEDDVPGPVPQQKQQKVLPAQDFNQRSYEGVDDEIKARANAEIARFLATGEVDM